jgi:hypothetical protein
MEVTPPSALCPQCGAEQPPLPPASSTHPPGYDPNLDGIAGWLILVAIGLVVSPFRILYMAVAVDGAFLFGAKNQAYLSSHHASALLIASELILNLVSLALILICNYLFFAKKKAFAGFIISFYVFALCFGIADHLAVTTLHPEQDHSQGVVHLAQLAVTCAVWIPYFLISRRVKFTFVD